MLSESLIWKIERLTERHEELEVLLSQPEVLSDIKRYEKLSKEYASLEQIAQHKKKWNYLLEQERQTELLVKDPDFKEEALCELEELKDKIATVEQDIKLSLIPSDPLDDKDVYLEVRAGTGGQEAALFAAELFRMYQRFVEKQGWSSSLISASASDLGGYKEVVIKISGDKVYSKLKFESGGHRVQRVPQTESQGRIHTSACTVAIMPEVDEIEDFDINPSDLRIDTYRASGAGGQHVNRTDSAIRITHIPTGVVVECQEDRSQHKNRSKAMSLLKNKLLTVERTKQQQEQSSLRQELIGSGDRSERIRTYNFPQGRLTDHRINLTLYKLTDIMEGDLYDVIDALSHEYQASLLADLEKDAL